MVHHEPILGSVNEQTLPLAGEPAFCVHGLYSSVYRLDV